MQEQGNGFSQQTESRSHENSISIILNTTPSCQDCVQKGVDALVHLANPVVIALEHGASWKRGKLKPTGNRVKFR